MRLSCWLAGVPQQADEYAQWCEDELHERSCCLPRHTLLQLRCKSHGRTLQLSTVTPAQFMSACPWLEGDLGSLVFDVAEDVQSSSSAVEDSTAGVSSLIEPSSSSSAVDESTAGASCDEPSLSSSNARVVINVGTFVFP